jgi:SAM-dependent methyltransferase
MDIDALLAERGGIQLDIGCGASKTPGFVGMDVRAFEGVDIVHNWNDFPWPLPDGCVIRAVASHVVEHVSPIDGHFLRWMDEVWRVCKPGAEFMLALPHGYSPGYLQDPTHCNACNENTWRYFDPREMLYRFYQPRPWNIKYLSWSPVANIEVILVKVADDQPGS